MTGQIHRASKKQKYDPNSGFPTPELVPQTSTRAASPQSLVWPTRGTCLFQIHFLLPALPQPLQVQRPSWVYSMQLQGPGFSLTVQEKDLGLSPSLVTHKLCHPGLITFSQFIPSNMGKKG